MQNLWHKQLIFKHHRCVTHFCFKFLHSAFTFYESFTQRGKGSFRSFGRRKACLFSRAGNFCEAKYILRESALHFELSIQSTSAKICAICGRKTSLLSTQRGKGSFRSFGRRKARLFSRAGNFCEAKIASARICFTLRIKHTINICENLRNLREKNFDSSTQRGKGSKNCICENLLYTSN
jgi:hypothetical protein